MRLIELLGRSGLRRIEVTSFVRPDVIPQLADASEVLAAVRLPDSVAVSVLIPNERGLERALPLRDRFQEINGFLSASESHNSRNVGRSVDESLAGLRRTFERALSEGLRCEGVISTSFGCPYEGRVPVDRVLSVARALVDAGCVEIGFGDTTGMANPVQVRSFFEAGVRGAPGRGADCSLPQHARAGARERGRGPGGRGRELRVLVRRARRLPGPGRRDRQHRDRGPGVDARGDGDLDGRDPCRRCWPPRARRKVCSAGRSAATPSWRGPFRGAEASPGDRRRAFGADRGGHCAGTGRRSGAASCQGCRAGQAARARARGAAAR